MRTNVLNDLSNVVKKGTGLAGSAAAAVDSCAAGSTTLAEYPGNHPVITQLSPRNHPLLDAIWKHVAMIFAVLVMSMANVGMAWGAKASWTSPNQSSLPTSLDDGKISLAWSKNSSSSQTSVIYNGGKSSAVARFFSDGSTLTIGTTSSYKIDSIIITIGNKSNSPAGFKTGGVTTGWSAFNTSGTNKYTVATPSAGNSFVITIYKTGGTLTNGRIDITGIDVYYVSAGGVTSHSVSAVTSTGTNDYGTVSAAASSVAEGGTTTITAVPASGYRVTNWAVSGAGASISPTGASNSTTTTLTMGTANATVTVTFGAIPTHTITYTNTKSMDNSANPTSYYEGVGVASFTKLRHAVGYDFTGWSPSSISSSATTNQTIDAQWTACAAAAGTGTLTYALAFGSGTITTTSITRNNGALYDATDVSLEHTSFADNANKTGCSGKLTTTSAKSESNYVELTFKIADGYTFTPTEVRVQGIAVSDNKTIEVELTDNAATPNSKSVSGTLTAVSSPTTGGYTVTLDFDASGTVTLEGTVTVKIFAYGATNHWRMGTPFVITGTVASAAPSCTAPNHVDVTPTAEAGNYGWRYTIGETLKLTATPYSSEGTSSPITSGITGYQWQKYVGNEWVNLSNGGDISGATSANLVISNLTSSNGGSYRCVISTGATCSTASTGYWVRVFTLNGNYYNSAWTENPIVWSSEYVGVATVSLNASSTYMFKVYDNDGKYFGSGSGNYIIEDGDEKDCGTGNADIRLFTGPAGSYTFTVDVTNAAVSSPYVNVVTNYPSVTHPAVGYMYITKWWDCYPHWWDGSSNALTSDGNDPKITKYTTICGTDYWYMPVLDNYTNVYFKDNATWGSAGNHGEETSSTGHSGQYYTHNGVSWGWHEFTTYTITTAVSTAGYGTVSAASVTGVACGTSISASSNTLTVGATSVTATATESDAQYTYAFDGWTWTPAGSTVTSNVTATANFTRTLNSYTVTWKNGATTLETDASVNYGATPSYDGSTPTKDADALYTYTFSGWSPAIGTVTGDATYSAQFTATPKTVAYGDATIYAYNDSKRVVSGTRKTAMETALAGSDGETGISGSLPLLHSVAGLTSVVLVGQCKSEVKASFPWLGSYIKMKTASTTATITFNVASGYAGTATIYFSGYNKTATLTNGANGEAKTSDSKNPETEGSFTSKNIALVSGANTLTISGNNGYISRIDVALAPSCTSVAAPTALTCSAHTSSSLTFTWTKATNASGYVASLYDNSACTGDPVASSVLGNVATVTFSTLTASTTYYCMVQSKGDGSTYCAAGGTTSAASGTTDADTPVGTTYYLVTSTAQLNTTDTYVIMDDGKNAMMGVYGSDAMGAITSGFTAAADKSTVTVTSSDVNTLTLQAESSAWNIVGKDDQKLTTNSTVGAKLYGNTPKANSDTKDDFVFEFGSGKATIKRNVTTDYHIYYTSGTGFNQSTSSTNIRLYTSNSTPVYTVTYDLNGGTGTVPTHRAEKSGATITLASSAGLTKSGYTFDGWLCNVNSTKYNAGASYTMTAANTTFTAQWEAVSGYTVTYNYNGATSGASPASATGTSVTLPTPTRTGYELDGWYTTAGTKAGIGGATYEPEADITLYAKWEEECDAGGVAKSTADVPATGYTTYQEVGGSNVVFTSAPSLGFKYKDAAGNTINNSTTAVVRNNAYSCQIKSDSGNKGSIKTNSTFSNVDSISFYFAASDKSGCKIAVWCSTDNFSTDSTSLLSATTYASNNSEFKLKTLAIPAAKKTSALTFKFRFTVTGAGKTCYMDSLKVYSSTSGGGTCYHVYYHGNGAESGYVNDTVSYTAGSKATVLNYNYGRYPLAKAGNDFQGWATSAGGAVAYTAGQKIDITSADVDLYAVWATASSALVTWEKKVNVATWTDNTTPSTTDPTNIGTIGSSATLIASPSSTSGKTPQIQLASGASNADKGASFTFSMKSADKVVVPTKVSCEVANVGSESDGDITYKAVLTDGAGNTYYSTNSICPNNNGTLNPIDFVFSSGLSLRGNITVKVYAWLSGSGSGFSFRMGPDVKFYGTVGDYACATPSAPTISGSSEYAVGQTITLTASHDGDNYDNLTTYTWYRGADWATASAASPVQDAATGEDGYTLTKTAVAADDDLFWCKVSNGTCEAHNATGYNVNVYAANTITWHLNDGTWGEVEHKDSYTRFDDDYTLPIPSKDGYVFAGWYEASDFSGVTVTVLGSGAIGDKNYYAKWGTAVTVSWTVTKVDGELYRGGGGYSVKAVINETDWNTGFMDELELTATEGVTLKNIEVSENDESKVQVTADFDITTDLAADATEISFTLNVPADGTYGPKVDEREEDLTDCGGGASGYTEFFSMIPKANTCSITNTTAYNASNHYTTCDCTSSATITTGGSVTFGLYSSGTGTTDKFWEYNSKNGGWKHSIANSWVVLYSTDQFKAGDSIVITNGNTSSSGYYTIVAAASNNTADYHSASQVAAPSTTSPAKNTNYYYKLPVSFVSSNYLVIRSSTSSSCYVGTIKAYHAAAKGGETPTLTWDDGDDDIATSGVSKSTSNDDFVYTASQDKNSLGAITYSSSDATVATVNATTGQVHLVGAAGSATITATIAASGCYESASVSYTITVTDDCDDEAGTIETEDLGCSGVKMTVTGHTAAAGVSYQWYKEGTPSDATVGTNQDNFTATEAGSYYVIVTNTGDRHCAKRSTNTITVEAQAAATATKIVDSWYVKNGRRTPDIELVKTTNATSFTVTSGLITIWESAGSTKTGFGGCGFHMDENGIIYLNGTKDDDGSATTGLTAGDETLTITAIGCGGNASQNITIHKQTATDYKEIAFVVDGEKGKDFDQVTSGHAAGTELYTYLDSVGTAAGKRLFKLTQQNIYSTTDEKAIRQHYSQFDGILITDDPSTNTTPEGDYKTKGYVNAFGTMVDVRPIFTMEAYVSALKNWGSKGIAGNPQSPNPRQYEMRLECKDHEIYKSGLPDPEDGTNVWEETIGGETFRHVIIVDSTKGVYNGVAYNAETAGNQKPALQGFTGEAAGSLLGLGRILEGTLQAAIERQEEPAARLLVMGINAKALQPTCALTNEGKAVIKNILTYLLKTNMEEVDDCSNYFTGKNSTSWSDPGNWSKSALPSSEAKVRILAPCVISGIQPHVLQVSIVNSGNSNIRYTATSNAVCNGTLTINADGALIADGKIRSAVAPHFAANDLMPTTPEMLTINTNGSGQAALIFNNEEGLTKAKVNLHSLGRNDGSYKYQYFAIPMEYVSVSPAFANETHGGTKIYTYVYNEASSGWTRRGYYDDLYAFEGLGITTKSTVAMNYTMTGTLASTATKEITLTHDGAGLNLIGNSWMAPIQIGALAEDNTDANITKTVYIYCAGRDIVEGAATFGVTETAGQWLAVPFEAADFATWKGLGKLSVIPAMQAFQIKTAAKATLTLDYDKVVRGSTNDLNAKLRAPRRRVAAKEVTMTNIRVSDSKTHTDLSLFEGERFSDEFDNGWEAEYMNGDGRSAKLYAETVDGKMAVVAMTDYEGTMVGFAPGQESVYIFSFMGADNGYYLNDIKMQQSVRISEGETYSFTYEDGDDASRFMISRTPFEKPGVATGTENIDASVPQARKILYNDKLYIIRGGHMYDATGKMVK